jgi:hypothetical protein
VRTSLSLVAGLLLWLAAPAAAQVQDEQWDDPSLEATVEQASLIVVGECTGVGPTGAAAYRVETTLKGPPRDGKDVIVNGLVAVGDTTATVEKGDKAVLMLLGEPTADVLSIPTPTFGRFPILDFGGKPQVVAAFSDTFVRVACPRERFVRTVQAILARQATDALLQDARAALGAAESNEVYQGLELLRLFGEPADEAALLAVLKDEKHAGPKRYRVRMVAAEALARATGEKAIAPLLELIEKDPVEAVKSAAATALGPVLKKTPPPERRRPCDQLAKLALSASSIPIEFGAATDPRRNGRAAPLAAILQTLAFVKSQAGVAPALRALERVDDVPATLAGLTYFGWLEDPSHAPAIANRMRTKGAEDELVNSMFQKTLEKLTGQAFGTDRDAWIKWCREQQLGGPSSASEGPPAPQGPAPPGR